MMAHASAVRARAEAEGTPFDLQGQTLGALEAAAGEIRGTLGWTRADAWALAASMLA